MFQLPSTVQDSAEKSLCSYYFDMENAHRKLIDLEHEQTRPLLEVSS